MQFWNINIVILQIWIHILESEVWFLDLIHYTPWALHMYMCHIYLILIYVAVGLNDTHSLNSIFSWSSYVQK